MIDCCLKTWPVLESFILRENQAQLDKWNIQDRTPFEWLGFATEELGEISKAISEWQFRGAPALNVVKEAVHAATLCIKIAEMFTAQSELQAGGCKDWKGEPVNCKICAAFAGGGCEGRK